ncbi:hypothetical protein QG37_02096 [Candidozyma auris]|uniref:Uncharacterized protein n=1 Tax=Candidozyma auris TaxID=498019 RepID=A0A0L0P4P5_CANAR|nr:hypothetical protein QG37_02096 [[Candida] auris]
MSGSTCSWSRIEDAEGDTVGLALEDQIVSEDMIVWAMYNCLRV